MPPSGLHNFHVPLSATVYRRLRDLADRRSIPATQLVKQAVEDWLEKQDQLALHEEIARYASGRAGTSDDLDEPLEAAGIEALSEGRP